MVATVQLFSASIHNASAIGEIASYYCNGYYTEGGTVFGTWWGSGAKHLTLPPSVKQSELFHLLRGKSTDGKRSLVRTQNERTSHRRKGDDRAGLDITFSVPKSVSILWAFGPPSVKRLIEQAIDESCKEALSLLEEQCLTVRTGKAGSVWERGHLVFAMFDHYVARNENDCQLHRHCISPNVAFTDEGKAVKLNTRALLPFVRTLGPLFRNILASKLSQLLGLNFYRPIVGQLLAGWFEIAGIKTELIDSLSSRRSEIDAKIESNGSKNAHFFAKQNATLHTRKTKSESIDLKSVQNRWFEKAAKLGIGRNEVQPCIGNSVAPVTKEEIDQAVSLAAHEITKHDATFDKWMLVRKTSELLQARPVHANEIIESVGRHLIQSSTLVQVATARGTQIHTTASMWKMEEETRSLIDKIAERPGLGIAPKHIEKSIRRNPKLSEEQQLAVRQILSSKGSLACLSGVAGAGKSTTLKTIADAARRGNKKLIGVSLAGVAAENLERSSGIPSRTIESFIREVDRSGLKHSWMVHQVRMFARAAMKKKTWKASRRLLDRNTILIVDEAGMLDTATGKKLLAEAERVGACVIAIGDLAQLKPIGAGTPFRTMIEKVGTSVLEKNWRQTEIEGQASQLIREGKIEDGLLVYAKKGDLSISKDRASAIRKLVTDWKVVGIESPESAVVLAQTNAEVRNLNNLCQRERLAAGKLGQKSVVLDGCKVHSGDRIRFRSSDLQRGLRNGYTATVLSIDLRGKVTVKLDKAMSMTDLLRGHRRVFKLAVQDLKSLKTMLAYTSTVHAYQGASVKNVFVLTGGKLQDRNLSYVSLSRSTSRCRIYTDRQHAGVELNDLVKSMKKQTKKENAIDVAIDHALKQELKRDK